MSSYAEDRIADKLANFSHAYAELEKAFPDHMSYVVEQLGKGAKTQQILQMYRNGALKSRSDAEIGEIAIRAAARATGQSVETMRATANKVKAGRVNDVGSSQSPTGESAEDYARRVVGKALGESDRQEPESKADLYLASRHAGSYRTY